MDSMSLLMIGAMLVVFWLFIIRPQSQQAKKAKEFQTNIEKGVRVVTTGGIHDRVIKVDEGSVLLEIDNNVKIRIEKAALSQEMSLAAYPPDGDKKADTPATKA